jgi:AcrR family transcriptional regulator
MYHDWMAVSRQGSAVLSDGRVNQKRRTRTAIVDAAQQLLDGGTPPTVAQAAEHALVSRATAYRYFPTQESLLVELAVNVTLTEVEDLVATPLESQDVVHVEARMLELVEMFNRRVLTEEARYRTALRLYLDMWLSASEASRDESPTVRAGRRTRWIAEVTAPLRSHLAPEELRKLQAALCLVVGIEPIVVLRDVCGLDPEASLEITRWTAELILRAAIES